MRGLSTAIAFDGCFGDYGELVVRVDRLCPTEGRFSTRRTERTTVCHVFLIKSSGIVAAMREFFYFSDIWEGTCESVTEICQQNNDLVQKNLGEGNSRV